VEKLIKLARAVSPDVPVVTDNCYGEFVETKEPPMAGADLTAGSLIKNPGGGLAVSGGYVCGRSALVEKAAEALTVPGIGRECGGSFGQNRLLFQGLFTAPHAVAQAVKTACFCACCLGRLGYKTAPGPLEARGDIIQTLELGDPDKLLRFVRGIQKGSPVDSFASPEPWDMPGYDDPVVMAAGTFVQGASIELSCDGPMREPYRAYIQGGITYETGKLGVLSALREMGAL
jgi:cystathionine beta-lyase family protein involved in aluminum resistance